MFAGSIETGVRKYGERLTAIHKAGKGLAGITPSKSDVWHGQLGNNEYVTLVEQPVSAVQTSEWKIYKQGAIAVAGWLRIDNKEELYKKLNLESKRTDLTDRALITKAYQHWGEEFTDHLVGDFSFALIDLDRGVAFLVRDHFGTRPFFYAHIGGDLIFASSASVVQELCQSSITVNQQWLLNYVHGISSDWVETNFNEIYKVPPANGICYENQRIVKRNYFSFESIAPVTASGSLDYVAEYRRLLEQAVHCRVGDVTGPIATESTGGLDSSTVTALASRFNKYPERRLHTFAYVDYEQEEECIGSLNKHVPMVDTVILREPKRIDQSKQEARDFIAQAGTAQEFPDAIGHNCLYRAAKRSGATVLLSGFGGDEFVTTYGSLAIEELFTQKKWGLWLSRLRGNVITKPIRGLLWVIRYWKKDRNNLPSSERISASPLDLDADEYDRLSKRLLGSIVYTEGSHSLNSFLLNRQWSAKLTTRLEQCSLAAAAQGLEYRWPLLDIRLVRFFLSAPTEEKYGPGGVSRYLHRRAVKDLLPAHLVVKEKYMGAMLSSETKLNRKGVFQYLGRYSYDDLPILLRGYVNQERYEKYRARLIVAQKREETSQFLLYFKRISWLGLWLESLDKNVRQD